jgi:hypothetical protein
MFERDLQINTNNASSSIASHLTANNLDSQLFPNNRGSQPFHNILVSLSLLDSLLFHNLLDSQAWNDAHRIFSQRLTFREGSMEEWIQMHRMKRRDGD